MASPHGNEKEVTTTTTSPPFPRYYPIGTPGEVWTSKEDKEWKDAITLHGIQRSYQTEVVDKLHAFIQDDNVSSSSSSSWAILEQYGALSHNPERYPLFAVRSKDWNPQLPNVLITGGVHGYETSGVQGAISFLQTRAANYVGKVNWVVAPCVSPWSYEYCQRWQADLLDPNRSFHPNQPKLHTEESKALMEYLVHQISPLIVKTTTTITETLKEEKKKDGRSSSGSILTRPLGWTCHVDLHETTDTDATEFMPAKHAKAGLKYDGDYIPDGFYLVGSNETSSSKDDTIDFLSNLICAVETEVTHIAPANDEGNLIDDLPAVAPGVILVPAQDLGLCCGMTQALYAVTTEVYPDSPTYTMTADICNQAQVVAVTSALDYILANPNKNTLETTNSKNP